MSMESNWNLRHCWLVHFDILGVKELFMKNNPVKVGILQSQIDDLIRDLKEYDKNSTIDYLYYADTFVLYADGDLKNYPVLLSAATRFFCASLSYGLPIRGSMTIESLTLGYENKIILGKALVECASQGERQNGLGFKLLDTAAQFLKSNGFSPERSGFVKSDLLGPGYFYNFKHTVISGASSLMHKLIEMHRMAPEGVKSKYKNTMDFIVSLYPKSSKSFNTFGISS